MNEEDMDKIITLMNFHGIGTTKRFREDLIKLELGSICAGE